VRTNALTSFPGWFRSDSVQASDRATARGYRAAREEGDDRQQDEGDAKEDEHDEMRNREQPLDEPEPAAEPRVESSLDANGMSGNSGHRGVISFRLFPLRAVKNMFTPMLATAMHRRCRTSSYRASRALRSLA
jgi:hypothetical protein